MAWLQGLTWIDAVAWLAAILAISGSAMRTIIPLRCIGIAANATSLTYAVAMRLYPSITVNLILLPLNAVRLYQMLRLIRQVKQAAKSDLSMDWLKPFMTRRKVKTGEILFAKGDSATCMFYTLSGRYRLKELGIELQQGQVVGEMGFLSPENRRTQTLECIEGGEVLNISYDEVRQLYFQNPEFGFYLLRLTSERMFKNMERLEIEVERMKASAVEQDSFRQAATA
ncbi:Crp/Fnr family transcriptional regulator [Microvirga makkahensis]|uniref:Cyclic nucleotide-binding domain-containing protein n=1 Tax=Microvirga makkahensis TaxID=1128670 RepID=A0A7X3MU46_9HYPH|nr:cyclic nucleotide-binding domain-containing protein [Microvirga makkahensis]MXQ13201.1 cyclic nucleotide-binding domain-containing protein [Microvirga makkahensis]